MRAARFGPAQSASPLRLCRLPHAPGQGQDKDFDGATAWVHSLEPSKHSRVINWRCGFVSRVDVGIAWAWSRGGRLLTFMHITIDGIEVRDVVAGRRERADEARMRDCRLCGAALAPSPAETPGR